MQGYLTNSDSEADIYFGASFDGATSKIEVPVSFNWAIPWKIEFDFNTTNVTGFKSVFFAASTGEYRLAIRNGEFELRINGENHTFDNVPISINTDYSVTVESTGGDDSELTITVDGVSQVVDLIPSTIGTLTSELKIATTQVDTSYIAGQFKNLKIINNGSVIYDSPLYKDSLDRSANCSHGTDTAITYLNNPASEIAALNPTIASTETLAQTDGNKKLILLGSKK